MPQPVHIAIVMDGNGRWAEKRRRPRTMGHQAGVKTARKVVRACAERGVKALTLFAFSSENWQRPASEVKRLMDLFLRALRKEVDELDKNGVRLSFIGDARPFSEELKQGMAAVQQRTQNNDRLFLTIAMNYGGRWDILQAVQKAAEDITSQKIQPEALDQEQLASYFSLSQLPEPDLLIRTGGERRISNFLLWQIAYTELYFSDVLWPDFDNSELDKAIDDFANRQRRYGKTGQQVVKAKHA